MPPEAPTLGSAPVTLRVTAGPWPSAGGKTRLWRHADAHSRKNKKKKCWCFKKFNYCLTKPQFFQKTKRKTHEKISSYILSSELNDDLNCHELSSWAAADTSMTHGLNTELTWRQRGDLRLLGWYSWINKKIFIYLFTYFFIYKFIYVFPHLFIYICRSWSAGTWRILNTILLFLVKQKTLIDCDLNNDVITETH